MEHINGSPLGLSTSQAAHALGVSLGTIRRWSDMGYLSRTARPGGSAGSARSRSSSSWVAEQQSADSVAERKVG